MTIGVVHLVRHANPSRYLEDFLRSYLDHPAGAEHELVTILKGFSDTADVRATIAAAVPAARFLPIDDAGFDINAYRFAAAELEHDRLCFVNSHARIEAAGWLDMIAGSLDRPEIGAAGATGSWEIMDGTTPFPNIHLRTNGIAVRRTAFLSLDFGPLETKRDCNRFEAGPHGMTRQILAGGRSVVIVGRDGTAYVPEEWPEARIFRSGMQENLLISDNRTRMFDDSTNRKRRRLARLAWGDRAMPASRSILPGWLGGGRD